MLSTVASNYSAVMTEPFDAVNHYEISDVKVEVVNNVHEESEASEQHIQVVDDFTSINVMDHLFKVEEEEVETRSSDKELSLTKREVDINSHDKVLKSATTNKEKSKTCMKNVCTICKKKFKSIWHLNTHMRTHTGEKPFTCSICSKKFSQKGNLSDHMIIHTGEKPFMCEICQKTFNNRNNVRTHKKTHTKEKPNLFTCGICRKKVTKRCLSKHMNTHSGEKPFTCDICKTKFLEKSYLIGHMTTHTGQKSYRCQICMKKFAQKGNLNKHMITHTRPEPEKNCLLSKLVRRN